MSTVRFRRPPRAPRPVVPGDDVALAAPPELARGGSSNVWFTALPALSGLGSVAYLLAGPPNPITYVAGSFFLFSALAMVGGSLLAARSQNRGQVQQQRGDFLRHLARTRDRVRRTAAAQRAREEWDGPAPEILWSVAASERLWERRPEDDDFGSVRIGLGRQQLATALVPGRSGPVEDLDPLSATALRRFVTTHRTVPDLPLKVALRRFAAIRVSAPDDPTGAPARALVRALLCQAAVLHAPADLIVAVCTDRPDHPDWAWCKWLPHAQHPVELDYAGPVRLIDRTLGVLEDLLGAELTRRAGFNPHAEPATDLPHVLLVLDGGRATGTELTLDPEGLAAVTVLDLDGRAADLVRRGGVALELDEDGGMAVVTGEHREHLGRPDAAAVTVAESLARQLAGYRLASGSFTEDLSVETSLPALLGCADAAALDLTQLWRARSVRDRLRAPLGVGADGAVVELDLKESAQDGMGPHGLLIGATGSGKSELLRTLVLGLAATHPPDALNLVLVDFKGGATFAGMSRLGHVAAVITNLQDDVGLVARMYEALSGELNRRQEILRAAGNLVSVRDYERARQRGVPLDPLPNLLVVVDEFSELIAQQEQFVELFVQIGRLGRSLGLHLLLASQRLEEGKIRGLEAHLSYRIALRTFSAEESRTVLGVDEAYTLPNSPGHGLLRTDTTVLTRFRAAYVSGAYRDGTDAPAGLLAGPTEVRPFPASAVAVPHHLLGLSSGGAPATSEEDPTQPTVLGVMVDQIAAGPGAAHQVWLPPLDLPEPLDALMGGLAHRPGRGFGAPPDGPELCVPIGSVDLPFQQRRAPFLVDLAGAGGHVGIVGRPRSGKSTALRTLVAALALRHTPAEVQFYCLDFSGALRALAGLPHVGGVAGRQEPDVVQRLVAEVAAVLEDRERRFRELGVDSMATYRRMRAEGMCADDPFGADPFGDVFLVVDGWGVLRGEFEELEATVIALAARSLTYGVHILLATNRWMDLRLGMRDIVGTKTELRLGDAIDSEIDRKLSAAVPDRAGRGIGPHRAHHLVGVPRVDGQHSVDGLVAGIEDLVDRVAAAWDGLPAPRVRLLPRLVELDELRSPGTRDLVLGLEGHRLGTVALDQRGDPGLLLVGDQETGKTATLRAIGRQIVESNGDREAKLVVVDYRRGLLGEFDGPWQLAYVGSNVQIEQVVGEIVVGLQKRLPGPDVTPAQLRERSWWQGPELHVLVDDYELVAGLNNPLAPLLPYLSQARDVGLHLYVARRAGGAARAMLDPVLGAMRELSFPAVLLSAPRDEMQLFGLRPVPQPPGRGTLVHRRWGTVPIQLARQSSRALV